MNSRLFQVIAAAGAVSVLAGTAPAKTIAVSAPPLWLAANQSDAGRRLASAASDVAETGPSLGAWRDTAYFHGASFSALSVAEWSAFSAAYRTGPVTTFADDVTVGPRISVRFR